MIKTNLKIAYRTAVSNPFYTLLNLLSLLIGFLVIGFALVYISFETTYESFHENKESVFRLIQTYRSQDYSVIGFPSWNDSGSEVQQVQIQSLKNANGVQEVVQFMELPNGQGITFQSKLLKTDKAIETNSPEAFSSIFTWKAVAGSLNDFAIGNGKVMITERFAKQLLQEGESLGKLIGEPVELGGVDYAISAIIQDVPSNSHFDFEVVFSKDRIDYWGSRTYVQRKEGTDQQELTDAINESIKLSNPRLAQDELYQAHYLQPIPSIHLDSNVLYESKAPGNKLYLFLVGFFGFFILLIILFNYTNLNLAIKSKQGISLAIKKTMGASSTHLLGQFMLEAFLPLIVLLPIFLVLFQVLTPFFNQLMGVEIPLSYLFEGSKIGLILLSFGLIAFVAAIFPSALLIPKSILGLFKNKIQHSPRQAFPVRKYLVISQLVVLIIIACVALVVQKQLDFVSKKDLGYTKDQILFTYTDEENLKVFQESLKSIPGVKHVGNGSSFAINPYNQTTYSIEGTEQVYDDANQLYLDYEGVKAYGLQFASPLVEEGNQTFINRTAANRFAQILSIAPEELIGKTIVTEPEYQNEETGQIGFPFTIAEIFEDINLFSLHEKVEPYFLTVSPRVTMEGRSIVAFEGKDDGEILDEVKKAYAKIDPIRPIDYQFLENQIDSLYESDERIASLLSYFTGVAIFLASLGIIGLTVFLTQSRKKEFGIRKILGANISSIIHSSFEEYYSMIFIAFLIALLPAFYLSSNWLEGFAFKISMPWGLFASVGAFVFCLLFTLVSIVAFKAAWSNPVESIRNE
ncbi:ABC transporter permease [Algoriphagus sp. oki45]|uniref:FtsX-like permease family protein n=1 Tax=Algoriphagus sp. oki45 TaxID=3067294 RepID=UPI0027FA321B|nr:ABC transporter permease [Algoriphagus sp. oki45]